MLSNVFRCPAAIKRRVNKEQNLIARVNKKQNIEVDSPDSSGDEVKYNVSFPLSPLDAVLPIPNFNFLVKNNFFFA